MIKNWFAPGSILLLTTCCLNASEKQIADLETDIAALKTQLEEISGSSNTSAQLLANIETAKAEIEKNKMELPEKESALAVKAYLLNIYKSAFRVTTSMSAGESLGVLKLNSGESLGNATFLKVEKGAILVQTVSGARSIPVSELPATLSSKLQLPPQTPPLSVTFESVKATKPRVLFTAGEIEASTEQPAIASSSVSNATTPTAVAAPPESRVAGNSATSAAAIAERNRAREKLLIDLKIRYAEVYKAKKDARAARADADSEFRQAKIKKAKSVIDAELARHDSRIDAIEEEESQLRAEMARVQASFE